MNPIFWIEELYITSVIIILRRRLKRRCWTYHTLRVCVHPQGDSIEIVQSFGKVLEVNVENKQVLNGIRHGSYLYNNNLLFCDSQRPSRTYPHKWTIPISYLQNPIIILKLKDSIFALGNLR